jgi:hypothetical protein
MSWVKVDDGFPRHPKVFVAAGLVKPHGYSRVLSMALQGNCYASSSLSDGFLPLEAVKRFHDSSPIQVAKALVKAKLWEDGDGGYVIHDYLDYNPSAVEVKQKRQRDSARKKVTNKDEDSAWTPERSREGDGSTPGSGFGSEGESEGEPVVHRLLTCYHDGYLARFGEKPNIQGGKDGKLLKTLVKTHGVAAVEARINQLLDTPDDFVTSTGRTLGVLSVCWNKLGGPRVAALSRTRPTACRHIPPCVDDAACTKRRRAESLGAAAS